MASAVVPVYQAEIAPREIRGRVVTLQQWAITWGILIQYFVQYGASFIDGGPKNPHQGPAAFRIPWGLQMIPAFILLVGMTWFPYSPRWLASKDRWEEAITVLADLHAGGDLKHPKVLAQYREIEEVLRFEKECRAAGWAAFLEPKMAKRVALGMSVQLWSELCGMNVMMYYILCTFIHCSGFLNLLVIMSQISWRVQILAVHSLQHPFNMSLTLHSLSQPSCMWINGVDAQPFF